MNIADLSTQRYTAKKYDNTKKIPEDQAKQLWQVLRNSPSSVNSQPWHFFIISTEQGKQKIQPAILDFNHDRINNASHVVIFCVRTPLTDAHLNNILAQEEKDGRFSTPELKQQTASGRRHFVDLNSKTANSQLNWEARQTYIALGNLLQAAAALGIDSTAIEGFDSVKMDELLDLKSKGLSSLVIASLGYHSDADYNAKLPKSRLPEKQTFTFM